ncbi:MAG: SDR family oxidoreductase [Devosia sp.]|nr:SDR family oxidoreductase [Devosia sp.]
MIEAVRDIEVDLADLSFRLVGLCSELTDAVCGALAGNAARVAAEGELADLLIVACPLQPEAPSDPALLTMARETGAAMARRGSGRIVFLLSAIAAVPMRRHFDHSVAMAGLLAGMRGLAMQLGPDVLVNAVGAGAIEGSGEDLLAGDRLMLGHAGLGRPGTADDVANAVLFLCDPLNSYTTGQLLNVDGGWSVGYGRNF